MIFQRLNMKKIHGIFSGKYFWKFGECNGGRNIWVESWVYLVYLQIFWELFYTWKMEFHDLVYIFRVLLAILRQLTLGVRSAVRLTGSGPMDS